MADRAKFLSFLDMIDGGGAGQVGGEFKGGGILSEIANLIATPYGSEDPERRGIAERRNRARRKALGLLDKIGTPEEQAAAASRAAATPSVVKRSVPPVTSSPRPQLRPATPATDPYAPLGGPNPAVQAEIQRRQEAQRMMEINQPMGAGGRAAGILNPAPSYAGMYMGEAGRGVPNLPRPVATTAALSPAGNVFSGTAPIAPMSEQLAPIAPATSTPAYPSGMSPAAPAMPQGVMSFRDFVDAERAAMSGADRYLDPANYRRGYARYLSSMGINPAMMGM